MFDPLAVEVGVLLAIMGSAMLGAGLLIAKLAHEYAGGFWGRRAADHGSDPHGLRAYRGPERRQRREAAWIDVPVY